MNLHPDNQLAKQQFWQGGATVGEQDYCFGTAELEVVAHKITLRLASYEKYIFEPSDVLRIEMHKCQSPGVLPAIAIQIHHSVKNYPGRIAFLLFCCNPEPYKQWLWEMNFEVAK